MPHVSPVCCNPLLIIFTARINVMLEFSEICRFSIIACHYCIKSPWSTSYIEFKRLLHHFHHSRSNGENTVSTLQELFSGWVLHQWRRHDKWLLANHQVNWLMVFKWPNSVQLSRCQHLLKRWILRSSSVSWFTSLSSPKPSHPHDILVRLHWPPSLFYWIPF